MTRGWYSGLAALGVLSLALPAVITACGPITPFIREHCDTSARAVGSAAEDDDIKLVQRLLLALSTNDFGGFQTLQPTQSQYLAYAWRHGAARADELVEVIQKPDDARHDFGALVTRLRAAGIEARSADRCTRRLAWDPKATDRYDLIVLFGSERLTVPVYASSERLSVAGRPDLALSGARVFLYRTLEIAGDLVERMERATTRAAALEQAEEFGRAHAGDLPKLEAEAVSLAELVTTPGMAEMAAHAMQDLGTRWQNVLGRFPGIHDDPRFQAALAPFKLLGNKLAMKARVDAPPLPPSCDHYAETMEACIAAMPPSGRGAASESFEAGRAAWSHVAPDELDAACMKATELAKGAFAATCPDVVWGTGGVREAP